MENAIEGGDKKSLAALQKSRKHIDDLMVAIEVALPGFQARAELRSEKWVRIIVTKDEMPGIPLPEGQSRVTDFVGKLED